MKIEGNRFAETIQVELDKYQMEVGILEDAPKKIAKKGVYKMFAGMRVAAVGRETKGSLVEVARDLDKRFHWLERPWRIPQNQAVQEVVNMIAESCNKNHANKQRVLNGTQAVIRNPILRGDYGTNSAKTAQEKGFNKLLIWTSQFFQAIKARYVL